MGEGLIEWLKAGKRGNRIDVLIELALFVPDETAVSCRANDAWTKVIYTAPDGAETTVWADDWSERPLATIRTLEAASRIAELDAKLATAVASLDEAAEYVERFADMRDGDYGGQQPNEAMQLAHSLRQAITDASK